MAFYKTRDIYEAAALICLKFRIINTERVGTICWFYFIKEAEEFAHQYWGTELHVEPLFYSEALKHLKRMATESI